MYKVLCPLCAEETTDTVGIRSHFAKMHNIHFDADMDMIKRMSAVGIDVEVLYPDYTRGLLLKEITK